MLKEQKEIFKESKEREPKLKDKVLSALKKSGKNGITNTSLNDISIRFGHYIYLLKIDGYDIEVENLGSGLVNYILKDTPLKKIKYEKGIDIVKKEIINNGGTVTLEELTSILDRHRLNLVRKPNGLHN